MVPTGKAGDIADIADHGGSDVRPDAEDLGEGGAGGFDSHFKALLGLEHLRVDAAQVSEEVHSELATGLGRSFVLGEVGRGGHVSLR